MIFMLFYCFLRCIYLVFSFFFFFKQKTAYEMRISDWSSDVCSSDLMTKRDSRPIDVEPLVPAIIRTPSPSLDYCQNLRREGFIELNQIDSVHSLRREDPSRRRGQMEGCLRLPPPIVEIGRAHV